MNVPKQLLGAVLAAFCLGAALEAQVPVPDARVDLRVEGRSLAEVVQYLREQSGTNIVVVDGGETTVSLDLTDVYWREALDVAAEIAGCVVEERTGGVLAITRPPRVDFAFDNAELTQVIDTIAKLSGANIVIAPEVAGTLTLRLTNVPWRDALDVAVKTLGYTVVVEDRGILRIVDPLSLQAQMDTRSYQLRYVRPPVRFAPVIESEFIAGELKPATGDVNKDFPVIEALKKALSPGGELDYIASQNVFIVRDTAQVHAQIKDMLDRLDVEPAQVFVDIKFVSTNNNDLHSLGVDYGDLGPQATYGGGQIPITFPFNLGSGGFEDLIIASPNGEGPFANGVTGVPGGNLAIPLAAETIFGALSFTQWAGTLRLLQSDVSTEVVQAPKLIALDGVPSTIFVGETIRYAEAKSEQGQAGGLQLSVQEASSSPVEVGFQLLVIPHVVPGTNKLTMEVIPKETSLSGTGDPSVAPPGFDVFTVGASGLEGSIALPRKRSSTIVTSMMLDSGQTAVIGGLTTETEIHRETRVPYLHKIPVIGWFFEHEERSVDKRNLMVFVTPTIVRSSSENQRILDRELQRRRKEYKRILKDLVGTAEAADAGGERAIQVSSPEEAQDDYQWTTFVQEPEEGQSGMASEAPTAPSMEDPMGTQDPAASPADPLGTGDPMDPTDPMDESDPMPAPEPLEPPPAGGGAGPGSEG